MSLSLRVVSPLLPMTAILLCLLACTEKKAQVLDTPTIHEKSLIIPPSFALNDTGISYGGDYPLGINQTCEGKVSPEHDWAKKDHFERLEYHGQDCASGRDVLHNDDIDGAAGFVFQKISKEGSALSPSAKVWACIVDGVSGLMWESKSKGNEIKGDSGLHDADDVFSWYSNDWNANGGHIGNWGRDNDLCSGYAAGDSSTYCNTERFIERVNSVQLCGHSDWRLPSVSELSSIIHFGATEPSVDVRYFPHTQNAPYWSSSLIATSNEQARYVNFRFGQIIWSNKEESFRLRLVRDVSCDRSVAPISCH